MSNPNGEMDPWADAIVTAPLPFVQVSAYYDQLTDVPASSVPQLPANPFGAWIAAKQPNIWSLPQSADQVADHRRAAFRRSPSPSSGSQPASTVGQGATAGPELAANVNGPGWLVTQSKASAATCALLANPHRSRHLRSLKVSTKPAAAGRSSRSWVDLYRSGTACSWLPRCWSSLAARARRGPGAAAAREPGPAAPRAAPAAAPPAAARAAVALGSGGASGGPGRDRRHGRRRGQGRNRPGQRRGQAASRGPAASTSGRARGLGGVRAR